MRALVLSLAIAAAPLAAQANDPIGDIESLRGEARATGPSGERVLDDGDDVFQGDRIVTGDDGSVEITFIDDTDFQIGPDTTITLDEFVFAGGTNDKFNATLLAGAFRFVSGNVAKAGQDAMRVTTPVATIGVRGTTAAVKLEGAGGQFALLEGDGGPAAIAVSNSGGSVVVDQVNFATTVAGPGQAPTPPEPLSRGAMDNLLGALRAATSGVTIPRVFGR